MEQLLNQPIKTSPCCAQTLLFGLQNTGPLAFAQKSNFSPYLAALKQFFLILGKSFWKHSLLKESGTYHMWSEDHDTFINLMKTT